MAIIDVVKSAATVLGIRVPDQLFAATSREMVEMQALVNRVALLVRDEYDWQQLKRIGTFTGDAAAEAFDTPSDFGRMLTDGELYSSSFPGRCLDQILSLNDWIEITQQSLSSTYGMWIIYGDQFHVQPIRATGETLTFGYLANTLVKPATGARKARFTLDDDTFVLDDRLLELAIIWSWKAGKNQAYAKELQDYEDAVNERVGSNKGPRILVEGRRRYRGDGAGVAFPNAVGTGVQDNTPPGYSILIGNTPPDESILIGDD